MMFYELKLRVGRPGICVNVGNGGSAILERVQSNTSETAFQMNVLYKWLVVARSGWHCSSDIDR